MNALQQVPALVEDLSPPNPTELAITMFRSAAERTNEQQRHRVPKGPLIERFLAAGRVR